MGSKLIVHLTEPEATLILVALLNHRENLPKESLERWQVTRDKIKTAGERAWQRDRSKRRIEKTQ